MPYTCRYAHIHRDHAIHPTCAGVFIREYAQIQRALIENPDSGSVIPGSGGVRKMRWRATGRGKRGGYRVIYFHKSIAQTFWMLTMYPKNVRDDIPARILRQIREEIENE